jgi:hypothetical protein
MRYKYTIKLVDDYDPESIILDLPSEVNLFAAFLFDAIKDEKDADKCISLIEKVVNNEMDRAEYFGDIYRATIERGQTVVEDIADAEEYHSDMRTADFEELLKAWIKEKKHVKEQNS